MLVGWGENTFNIDAVSVICERSPGGHDMLVLDMQTSGFCNRKTLSDGPECNFLVLDGSSSLRMTHHWIEE